MTGIPIVIGARGTIPPKLVQRLEDLKIRGLVETIQNTGLLRSPRILRIVLKTCCHSDSSENPSANAGGKTPEGVKNNDRISQEAGEKTRRSKNQKKSRDHPEHTYVKFR